MKTALPPGTLAIAVARSANKKIGEAATTYAAQGSCPSSCVFYDGGGCYAESGAVGKFVTAPLNRSAGTASALAIAEAEAAAIDSMRDEDIQDLPLRLHTVGDCSTDEAARIIAAAAERYRERGGGPVWTYTHAWRIVSREAWGRVVSVLASCERASDVTLARSRGYATALVVEQFESEKLYTESGECGSDERPARRYSPELAEQPAGPDPASPLAGEGLTVGEWGAPVTSAPILPCPAQTRDVPCSSCRLCFHDLRLLDRGYSIGFALHGVPLAVRAARAALRSPDDPDRRKPSEQRIREIRAHYLEQGREPTAQEVCEEIPDLSPASVYEWLRYLRGEIVHPSERRRRARAA